MMGTLRNVCRKINNPFLLSLHFSRQKDSSQNIVYVVVLAWGEVAALVS